MEQQHAEPNGKAKVAERSVSEALPQPSDQVAAPRPIEGTFARPMPVGKVSNMAERQRDREVSQPAGGAGFFVNIEQLLKLAGAIAAAAAMWWSLKGDLREMNTKMDFQTKIQEERWNTQQAALQGLDRKWQLQQYDIQQINIALAKAGISADVKLQGATGGNGR